MKRLVLAGGGHAHLAVLKDLAARPLPGVEVTLLSPHPHLTYSGMVPGWVAGHYTLDQCRIPLAPLAAAAGATFRVMRASALDPARRVLALDGGGELPYDVLSLDVGSAANVAAVPGAGEYAIALRPLEDFVHAWQALREAAPARVAVVGAGAAGVEVTLAMRHTLPDTAFTLVSAANTLPGTSGPRLARRLVAAGVRVRRGTAARRIDAHGVMLDGDERIDADAVIAALGAVPLPWLTAAGLALDDAGFVRVGDELQSTSHPGVFAAGDCATMSNYPRPRSGVYAVRAGPPLAANLRRALQGQPLNPYRPQARSLYLVSTGDRRAVGSWGDRSWEGAWVWRWKDHIDRAFISRHKP